MDSLAPVLVCLILFIGVPWIFLHYITQWKKSSSISAADENLIEELYESARKLEERLQTIERIIAAENNAAADIYSTSKEPDSSSHSTLSK
ncbi:envelope stress response membrane protein PspB [Zymomonas sp.]|uniref:envelope stress response membrane protein PspB n=1 Tax=Zymomonas sp. TaxID=2068624 RepID=UPI0026005AAB|nr:envelope stress response membrane protein PspB [Zymomonas sp.]MCA1956501.1 envelope stress response membrane protein PspB [Zymomonas sp.]